MQSPKYSLLPASEEDVLEENCEHDDISLEGLLARPGARVPEPYSTIIRCRRQRAAVWREGDSLNPMTMALEGLLARPSGRVPEPYSTIVRRRCPNPITMALEGLQTGVPAFSNTANILHTG